MFREFTAFFALFVNATDIQLNYFFLFIFLSVSLLRGYRVILIAVSVHLTIVNTQGVYK